MLGTCERLALPQGHAGHHRDERRHERIRHSRNLCGSSKPLSFLASWCLRGGMPLPHWQDLVRDRLDAGMSDCGMEVTQFFPINLA